jgi:F-type H+/Na+-transporting ATPase subunit alpha
LAAFAQFGADQLDKATQAQLARGQRLTEILKQDQFAPFSVQKQVLSLFVATSGVIDNVPVDQVRRFESEFIQFVESNNAGILKTISEKQALDDGLKADIKKAADSFKERFMASLKDAAPVAGEKEKKAAETKAPAAKTPEPAAAKH